MANEKNKLRVVEESKVSFEVWFSQREKAIPLQHHREILKADFKGQGLGAQATIADFDKALRTYGVKLS